MRFRAGLLAVLSVIGLASLGAKDSGADAEITDLRVALEDGRVLVSFDLRGAFDQRLLERVESGLPTSIAYRLVLLKDRKRWFDRSLEDSRLTVVAMYDAMRREYLINYKQDGRLLESRMVHDLDALERAMTHFERLPAFTLPPEPKGERLLVRARAELGSKTVLWLIPTKITTGWEESRKFRPGAEGLPEGP